MQYDLCLIPTTHHLMLDLHGFAFLSHDQAYTSHSYPSVTTKQRFPRDDFYPYLSKSVEQK